LNRFLTAHRILAVDRHVTRDGGASVWAVCVSYEPAGASGAPAGRRSKVDYREVLSEADFMLYARLRSLRKEIAEREGVPLYSLFTNDQMAEMVTRRVSSIGALREIPGIGEGRVEKYGAAFLAALGEARASAAGAQTGNAGDDREA
jgi:superfamily II DNA helicase RecQ